MYAHTHTQFHEYTNACAYVCTRKYTNTHALTYSYIHQNQKHKRNPNYHHSITHFSTHSHTHTLTLSVVWSGLNEKLPEPLTQAVSFAKAHKSNANPCNRLILMGVGMIV